MQLWALQSKLDPGKVEPYQSNAHPMLGQELHHRPRSIHLSHFFFLNLLTQQPGPCACTPKFVRLVDLKINELSAADCLSGLARPAKAVWRAAYHAPSAVDYPAEPFPHQQELRLRKSEAGARHDGHQSP